MQAQTGERIDVTITDTGCGMDEPYGIFTASFIRATRRVHRQLIADTRPGNNFLHTQ